MAAAATVSELTTGFTGAVEQRDLIASLGLPTEAPPVSFSRVAKLMTVDKKRDERGIRFVALEAVGAPTVVYPDDATVLAALASIGIEQ